jgi:NAD-dependent dihydropyrimidine dehydrogenase PreA subunit
MAYVIAEPCIGVKDTACVDACPVDCIHPKKETTYDDGRPTFEQVSQLYIDPIECIDCGACVPKPFGDKIVMWHLNRREVHALTCP